MLKKDIKKIAFVFLLFGLFQSCNISIKSKEDQKGDLYVFNNFNTYKEIFNITKDSIDLYVQSHLKSFLTEYGCNWQIDSLICINSKQDRLVAVIISSAGIFNHDVTDDASKILGKKINNKWSFFKGGGSLAILRSAYGKDGGHPLSFHELSQIARKEFLESALIKKEKGEYVVNDAWVDEHFYNNGFDNFTHHKVPGMVSKGEEYQMPRDKEKTDSVHWFLIIDKWRHKIDTNEYNPLRRNKINI